MLYTIDNKLLHVHCGTIGLMIGPEKNMTGGLKWYVILIKNKLVIVSEDFCMTSKL